MPPPYERFDAWKVAHKMALEVYKLTERWPACERYQLTSQVRRAALSVPTNIAEGVAKRGTILDEKAFHVLDEQRNETGKVMWGLYLALSPIKSR